MSSPDLLASERKEEPRSDDAVVRSDFRKLVRMILSKRHHYGEILVEAEDLKAKHGL